MKKCLRTKEFKFFAFKVLYMKLFSIENLWIHGLSHLFSLIVSPTWLFDGWTLMYKNHFFLYSVSQYQLVWCALMFCVGWESFQNNKKGYDIRAHNRRAFSITWKNSYLHLANIFLVRSTTDPSCAFCICTKTVISTTYCCILQTIVSWSNYNKYVVKLKFLMDRFGI